MEKARLSRFAIAVATCVLGGCSSGDDVYIQSRARSGLTCEVTPGEDVCGRDWTRVPADRRATVAASFEAVATLAGVAKDTLTDVESACRGLLVDVGAPIPAPTADDLSSRAAAACASARSELVAIDRSVLTVTVGAPTCTTTPRSECASARAKPYSRCVPAVNVTIENGASDRARLIAAALEKHLPRLLAIKSALEFEADLASEITGSVDTLREIDESESCAPGLIAMLGTASDEVRAATAAVAAVATALHL